MACDSKTGLRKQAKSKAGKLRAGKSEMSSGAVDDAKTISIIGAGRLGTALAIALASKGYTVQAIVSRHLRSARRAARLSGQDSLALTSTQLSSLPPSKLIFITTPDDAIESVAQQLSTVLHTVSRGRIALHTSGALSSEALQPLSKIGFQTGSMHPLLSISDSRKGASSLANARFCIEGQSRAMRIARAIVSALGGKSFSIKAGEKALYHAAAVMTSGHLVALFDIVRDMMMRCGLDQKQAGEVLLPLLGSTVENLAHYSPAKALTGTFARADSATVRKHLKALRAYRDADTLNAYRLLGIHSLKLARQNGVDVSSINEIKSIIDKLPD